MTRMDGRQSKTRLVQNAAMVWIGFMVVASVITFLVVMLAVSSQKAREAAEETPAPILATYPATYPAVTVVPDDQIAQPTRYPTPATVGLDSEFALGGQVPGFFSHVAAMHDAGMTWAKLQIKWTPETTVDQAREFVETTHQNGFKILLSIAGELYPQSIDYEGYVAYLEEVAALHPDAIEIWNEMNMDREWPTGQIDPAIYIENMLAPAYTAIKSVSPETTVIIGAPTPTGSDDDVTVWADWRYVQGLAEKGAADYADCLGIHHNSGTTSPLARSGHAWDGGDNHYSWYFLPSAELYYEKIGGRLPLCVTELGYLTPEGIEDPLPEKFGWGAGNTLAEQAAWLAEAVDLAQELGYIRMIIVWNVDFTNWGDDDPFKAYAIIRPDGTCSACSALRTALEN
nr:hypothetical protein [Anaerolineae bacterium]